MHAFTNVYQPVPSSPIPSRLNASITRRTLRSRRIVGTTSALPRPSWTEPVDRPTQVTTIQVMSETLPLAQVKSKFSEMVDRVEHTHDRIVVTRNGRPAAVMISPEELASIEDTLDLLSDPAVIGELEEARQADRRGDYITSDDLRSHYTTR